MISRFLEVEEKYDGSQLVSLRNYLKHGILGDSIVAWIGACDVSLEHMVDGEDVLAKASIAGSRMLHFIVEKFDCTLLAAVALQRLLATIVKDELQSASPNKEIAQNLRRDGDDIYWGKKKLSISIATQSPVNSLIHFAVNISNTGTPVETLSLEDLNLDPKSLAQAVMKTFVDETIGIAAATRKVRWVR